MRWFTPSRLAAAGLFLLGAAVLVLWLIPDSGTDIRLVDPAHPVDPIVSVPNDARTPQMLENRNGLSSVTTASVHTPSLGSSEM